MATDILLVRRGNRLEPADVFSSEFVGQMTIGEVVAAQVRRPRNLRHHRKFFALLNVVYAAQERYATTDQLLDAIKIRTGHYDLHTLPGDVPVPIIRPRSISFAKMDQKAFEEFYEKAVAFILTDVLPGVDRPDLDAQVLEILGDS